MKALCLVVNPIAWFLDYLLGVHKATRFQKKDLRTLIELHEIKKDQMKKGGVRSGLREEETTMVVSLLDLRNILTKECMVKWEKVFSLNQNEELDDRKMARIAHKGFSKIPILSDSVVKGFLKVKSILSFQG